MIHIHNLSINYGNEVVHDNFNLHVAKGEKVAIMGQSGSGKSTLFNLIAGFLPSYKGEIIVQNRKLNPANVFEIRKLIAWLPQDTFLNSDSVRDTLLKPFEFKANSALRPSTYEISTLLHTLGLDDEILDKEQSELSGGQRQRILLASCLLLKKPILLLDEPTSAMDDKIKIKIIDHIMSRDNLTVLIITHDHLWRERCDRTINLSQ